MFKQEKLNFLRSGSTDNDASCIVLDDYLNNIYAGRLSEQDRQTSVLKIFQVGY